MYMYWYQSRSVTLVMSVTPRNAKMIYRGPVVATVTHQTPSPGGEKNTQDLISSSSESFMKPRYMVIWLYGFEHLDVD